MAKERRWLDISVVEISNQLAHVNYCSARALEREKGNFRKIPSNKACQADQVIILSRPPFEWTKERRRERKIHRLEFFVQCAHICESVALSGTEERKIRLRAQSEWREKSPFRALFVSDMRGKCIRKADVATSIFLFVMFARLPSTLFLRLVLPKLTRTNCPVLLNPVPFFIKIKKKFIRTHCGALEL
jgi:hypothetical protein